MSSLIDYEEMECKFCGGTIVPNGDFDVECLNCDRVYSLIDEDEEECECEEDE